MKAFRRASDDHRPDTPYDADEIDLRPAPDAVTNELMGVDAELLNGLRQLTDLTHEVRGRLDRVEQQGASLDRHERALDRIEALLEDRREYESRMGQVYAAMAAELDDSRPDRRFHEIRPLLLDLVRLVDRLRELVEHAQPDGHALVSAVEEVLEILARNGVTPFRTPLGETFSPETQERIGGAPTDDARLAGRVAASVRDGYRRGERLLRAESVTVWQLT